MTRTDIMNMICDRAVDGITIVFISPDEQSRERDQTLCRSHALNRQILNISDRPEDQAGRDKMNWLVIDSISDYQGLIMWAVAVPMYLYAVDHISLLVVDGLEMLNQVIEKIAYVNVHEMVVLVEQVEVSEDWPTQLEEGDMP